MNKNKNKKNCLARQQKEMSEIREWLESKGLIIKDIERVDDAYVVKFDDDVVDYFVIKVDNYYDVVCISYTDVHTFL